MEDAIAKYRDHLDLSLGWAYAAYVAVTGDDTPSSPCIVTNWVQDRFADYTSQHTCAYGSDEEDFRKWVVTKELFRLFKNACVNTELKYLGSKGWARTTTYTVP